MTDAKHYMDYVKTEEYKKWEDTRATGFKPASLNIIEPMANSGHPKAIEVMKRLDPNWVPNKDKSND